MVQVLKKAIRLAPAILLALPGGASWAVDFGPRGAAGGGAAGFASVSPAGDFERINAINREAGGRWRAGETSMTRLTEAERRLRLGLRPPARAGSQPGGSLAAPAPEPSAAATLPLAPAPPSLDWRDNGGDFVTAVRDQGSCGSCWAFAAAAVLESSVLIDEGRPGEELDLSEQTMITCLGPTADAWNDCRYGGSLTDAAAFIRGSGLPLESWYRYSLQNWPYSRYGDNYCGGARTGWRRNGYHVTGFIDEYGLPAAQRVARIKELVANYGPIAVGLNIFTDFYYYTGGVYRHVSGSYQGGHAVVVVGYSDAGSYFIAKNSWGTGWGADGFFLIDYDQIGGMLYEGSGPYPTQVAFGSWISAYEGTYLETDLPDLVASPFPEPAPATALTAGDAATLSVTVRNANPIDAGASTARLWLSTDGDLRTRDDWAAGPQAVAAIPAGGALAVDWPIDALPSFGRFPRVVWPILRLDSGRAVEEFDEANKFFGTPFWVEPPVWVRVTAPNGGETWYRGQDVSIGWEGDGCGTVAIQLLRRTPYNRWRRQTIEPAWPAAPGTYDWTVPAAQRRSTRYKVRVACNEAGAARDASNRTFRIQ